MFQTTNQFNMVMFHSYSYQKVSRLVNVPYMEHTYIYIYISLRSLNMGLRMIAFSTLGTE